MAEQRPATVVPSRVFSMEDWAAPAQELSAPDHAASSSSASANPVVVTVDSRNENRLRSMSQTLLGGRPRPESFMFPTSQQHADRNSFALPFRDLEPRQDDDNTLFPGAGIGTKIKMTYGHGHGYGHSRSVSAAAPGGFKTLMRRASMSLKGIVHPSKRHSVAHPGPATDGDQPARPFTSHAHAHPPSPSPSPSPWQRLRHAAHLGHHRASHGAEVERPRFGDPFHSSSAALPTPGSANAPPYIPRNTGAAAKAAAAAAQQSLYCHQQHHSQGRQVSPPPALRNRHWLGDFGGLRRNHSNDRESGIGIMVTGPDEAGPDTDTAIEDGDDDADTKAMLAARGQRDANISRVDFVARAPVELAIQILACLDGAALANASLVSRRWNEVVGSQHVWREAFLRAKTTTYATSRAIAPGSALGVPAVAPHVDWRDLYRVREQLDHSWKVGSAKPIYLNGHQDSIYCLQFDESKIITGSRDRTIRIWDMHTLECRLVIGPPAVVHDASLLIDPNGQPMHYACRNDNERDEERVDSFPATSSFDQYHDASILCLQYDDRILVTGSSDGTCIVHDATDGYRPLRRLRRHSAAVLDLAFDDRHIVTCSKDHSICVWERETGRLLRQLQGHGGPVNAVQLRGNTIVSCSGDFRVKLWNVDTGKCIREFVGHTKGLACSQFTEDGRFVASAGNDKVIRVWDANTGECLREIRAHDNLVRSLHIDSVSGRLVSGSYDTDIKVFDLETGRQLIDFPRWHASWVLSAKSDYRRIVSTGQDPKILIMDFGADIHGIDALESMPALEAAAAAGSAAEQSPAI